MAFCNVSLQIIKRVSFWPSSVLHLIVIELIGQYEETISQFWHRLVNLCAFFGKSSCSQPISACYDLFKSFVPSQARNPLDVQDLYETLDNDESNKKIHIKEETVSDSLQTAFRKVLGANIPIPLCARFSDHITVNNQSFTSSKRHKGNSGILRINCNVPFCIDRIAEFDETAIARQHVLQGKWLVGQTLKPIFLKHDPYSTFPYIKAKLWSTELEANMEVCRLDEVEAHFAQHHIS